MLILWEPRVNPFCVPSGKDFMLEAIDLLKGVSYIFAN